MSLVMDAGNYLFAVDNDIDDDQLNIDSQDCKDRLPTYEEIEYQRMMDEDMPCMRCIHCTCLEETGKKCVWCTSCKCNAWNPKKCRQINICSTSAVPMCCISKNER